MIGSFDDGGGGATVAAVVVDGRGVGGDCGWLC